MTRLAMAACLIKLVPPGILARAGTCREPRMPRVILSFPRGIQVEALEMSGEKPGELAPLLALG